jgi:hypothetical protein
MNTDVVKINEFLSENTPFCFEGVNQVVSALIESPEKRQAYINLETYETTVSESYSPDEKHAFFCARGNCGLHEGQWAIRIEEPDVFPCIKTQVGCGSHSLTIIYHINGDKIGVIQVDPDSAPSERCWSDASADDSDYIPDAKYADRIKYVLRGIDKIGYEIKQPDGWKWSAAFLK